MVVTELVVEAMIGVVNKFFITSTFMWAAPVAILYGFNHKLLPGKNSAEFIWIDFPGTAKNQETFYERTSFKGSAQLSPESMTLWSGILAVISVNAVIGLYIYLAMKEPSDKHEPDPKFLADMNGLVPNEADRSRNDRVHVWDELLCLFYIFISTSLVIVFEIWMLNH